MFNRRHFLGTTSALPFVAAAAGSTATTTATADDKAGFKPDSAFDSYPLLQNPTEKSINVVWSVKTLVNGWVEWGTEKEKLDQKAVGAVYGLRPLDDRVIAIRIDGLKPNTTYYYRAVVRRIDYSGGAYRVKQGAVEASDVYSFTTPGAGAGHASFAVINDTHQAVDTLRAHMKKLAELKADYTVLNGDLTNNFESMDVFTPIVMRPADAPFATERPVLLGRGNHDHRGRWARELPKYLTPWEQPKFKYRGLGYSGWVRQGDLAMILMDTGEDKADFRQEWAGMASFEPYVELQGKWLADIMEKPEIKTAPFIVLFCHIPLFDDSPNADPGTLETGFSSWKKLAADHWGPTMQKYGVQLAVCAHIHHYTYKPATADRCWAQITGGGPNPKSKPTVIHGAVENGVLKISVYNSLENTLLDTYEFKPRKV